MNKLFKLTGVSMLAIVAASGANAAGYTCEELVEYTSCNPGYYLEKAECPDEYTYYSSLCRYSPDDGASYLDECSKEECDGDEFCTYLGTGCAYALRAEGESAFIQTGEDGMCNLCPVGSICAGGTAGAIQCPAGSYCATTGLSQPTGKCNVGTYSYAGATSASCTACPSTGLTDINGAVVNGTTLSAGSTGITACIVGSDAQFKDDAGIYHYKQNCSFDLVEL